MNFFSVIFFASILGFFIGCKESSQDFPEKEQLFLTHDSSEFRHENPDQKIHLDYKTFRLERGWGYDIYINNKRKLHQPHIPAINDLKGFRTEEEAEKVALLTIQKIKKASFPPAVTKQELDSLSINF